MSDQQWGPQSAPAAGTGSGADKSSTGVSGKLSKFGQSLTNSLTSRDRSTGQARPNTVRTGTPNPGSPRPAASPRVTEPSTAALAARTPRPAEPSTAALARPTQRPLANPPAAASGTPSTRQPTRPTGQRRPKPRQTRKARLRISRVDPYSVMKTALLFGVAGGIMFVVAIWVVFTVLDATGLWTAINDAVANIFAGSTTATKFDIKDYINTSRATAFAALIAAIDVLIITALATIFAFLYNLSANMLGGIEVTLAED